MPLKEYTSFLLISAHELSLEWALFLLGNMLSVFYQLKSCKPRKHMDKCMFFFYELMKHKSVNTE